METKSMLEGCTFRGMFEFSPETKSYHIIGGVTKQDGLLMAAAPELLAACNLATATIERLVGYKEWSSAKGTLDVLYAAIRAAEPQSEGRE